MPAQEQQNLSYTATCRGDLETIEEFVTHRLDGRLSVLLRNGSTFQVEITFPARWKLTVDALHETMIRDADGGCCWISLRDRNPDLPGQDGR